MGVYICGSACVFVCYLVLLQSVEMLSKVTRKRKTDSLRNQQLHEIRQRGDGGEKEEGVRVCLYEV